MKIISNKINIISRNDLKEQEFNEHAVPIFNFD